MVDNKAILSYLSDNRIHHFTFHPQFDKNIKADIHHLRIINTSSQDTILAFQDMGYDIISVKQMTIKSFSPDDLINTISLPIFLVIQARSQNSHRTLSLTRQSYRYKGWNI